MIEEFKKYQEEKNKEQEKINRKLVRNVFNTLGYDKSVTTFIDRPLKSKLKPFLSFFKENKLIMVVIIRDNLKINDNFFENYFSEEQELKYIVLTNNDEYKFYIIDSINNIQLYYSFNVVNIDNNECLMLVSRKSLFKNINRTNTNNQLVNTLLDNFIFTQERYKQYRISNVQQKSNNPKNISCIKGEQLKIEDIPKNLNKKDIIRVSLDKNNRMIQINDDILITPRLKDITKEIMNLIITKYPNEYEVKIKKNMLTKEEKITKTQQKQFIELCNNKFIRAAESEEGIKNLLLFYQKIGNYEIIFE